VVDLCTAILYQRVAVAKLRGVEAIGYWFRVDGDRWEGVGVGRDRRRQQSDVPLAAGGVVAVRSGLCLRVLSILLYGLIHLSRVQCAVYSLVLFCSSSSTRLHRISITKAYQLQQSAGYVHSHLWMLFSANTFCVNMSLKTVNFCKFPRHLEKFLFESDNYRLLIDL
jgi:hypothetical protein